jgi:TatD DNase family protein
MRHDAGRLMSKRHTPPRIDGLIDAHCHLDHPPMSEDLEAALATARAAGVVQFVHIGCSVESMDRAVQIAEAHDDVFAAVGIHPHEASSCDADVLAHIETLTHRPGVVAIGETGLDYFYDRSPRPAQREALAAHVRLAAALDLPLVLHVRDAHDEAQAIVDDAGPRRLRPGMVHCFTGTPRDAERWLQLGFDLSFSGIVTFPKSEALRDTARLCPADRLHLETDAPYLSPVPVRGPRNEPAHVAFTCAHLAGIRGLAPEALAHAAAANTRALFALPSPSQPASSSTSTP